MSIETAAVIGPGDTVIHMHEPPGRSISYLPDSQSLWDVSWENKMSLVGIAHTHPGSGYPGPSRTDLTTFEAMEKGLGRRLKWWILSSTHSILLEWNPVNPGYDVTSFIFPPAEPPWMLELRRLSFPEISWPDP